jgi:hypothetical protein
MNKTLLAFGSHLAQALSVGMMILTDLSQLLAGQETSFTFSWHGRTFYVSIAQPTPKG